MLLELAEAVELSSCEASVSSCEPETPSVVSRRSMVFDPLEVVILGLGVLRHSLSTGLQPLSLERLVVGCLARALP